MAIAYRSASSAEVDLELEITVDKPADTVAGDVLVAVQFATGSDTAAMTAPAGWGQVGGDGSTAGTMNGKVFYRIVDSDDDAVTAYTFGVPDDASCVVFCHAFSGVNPTLPIPVSQWGGSTISTTAHVAPEITPSTENNMLLCAWGSAESGARSYTPPSGMTETGDRATNWTYGSAAIQQLTGSGSPGTRTATSTVVSPYLSLSLVLAPAGPGGGAEELVSWIAPDGSSTVLDVEWALSGRFAPPPEFQTEGIPGQSGLRLREVKHTDREMTFPIWLTAQTEGELRHKLRQLVYAMDPTRGEGKIRVITPTGDQREINCRYSGGLDVDETLGDTSGIHAQKAAISFRAFDPYWQDANSITVEYTTGSVESFFPFFPLRLTSSEVFTDATLTNAGDVQAWPVWEIVGPGENISLINQTSGRRIVLEGVALANGESIVIDTQPGAKTLTHSNGANMFPYLSTASSLWPILQGGNAIRIEMSDSTETSKVILTYRPRYLTA